MTISDAIGAGFRLVHRNWQLVLIQFLMSVLGCIAFFVIIGLPLLVALVMLGIDIAELAAFRDFMGRLSNPAEIINRYLGIVVVAAFSLLLYALLAFSLWIYVAGGSAGILGGSIRGLSERFTLREFMREGRRLFFPLAGYAVVIGMIAVAVLLFLGVLGGALASGLTALSGETALELFFKTFSALLFITSGIIFLFGLGAVALTGVAAIVLEGSGPLGAINIAHRHLNRHPRALGLYAAVFAGYIAIDFVLMLTGYPLTLLPFGGVLLSLPFRLLSYVVQGYLCLVMLAAAFAHYASFISAISGDSTPGSGTSSEGAPPQGPPPYQ